LDYINKKIKIKSFVTEPVFDAKSISRKDGKEDDLISSGLFIGESIGTIYGYEIEGIWQIADKENGKRLRSNPL